MGKFFSVQRLSFLSGLGFMLMKLFFFDFTLFFIKCGKYVNNLPSGIISAISAHVMGNSFLSTVAACAKSPRFQRVVAAHPIAVPFRMSHADYHILRILAEMII